jgi:hypothetical protein
MQADTELHVTVRFVLAEVAVRFGSKVPPDLDTVIRYYVGVQHAFARAALHVVFMAKVHGVDGAKR